MIDKEELFKKYLQVVTKFSISHKHFEYWFWRERCGTWVLFKNRVSRVDHYSVTRSIGNTRPACSLSSPIYLQQATGVNLMAHIHYYSDASEYLNFLATISILSGHRHRAQVSVTNYHLDSRRTALSISV